jgi:hypothetical protein
LVAGANTRYTEERKVKKGCKVMLTPKNSQKSLPAAIAHENDLLDEALNETFPASDPIAINVDLKSPGHGMDLTPAFRARLRGRARRRRGNGMTVATARLELRSDA